MGKSFLLLAILLNLSFIKPSFAGPVDEPWCYQCPPGSVLTLITRDRYYCMGPGPNQSSGVPLWAKPSWAKVIWDVQGGRCIDTYTRAADFCFRCPAGYAFTIAKTIYGTSQYDVTISGKWDSNIGNTYIITQNGNSFSWTVPGHKEVATGTINDREVSAKWGDAPGKWLDSATGTIETVDDQGRATKIVWSNGAVFMRAANQGGNR